MVFSFQEMNFDKFPELLLNSDLFYFLTRKSMQFYSEIYKKKFSTALDVDFFLKKIFEKIYEKDFEKNGFL